MKRKSLSMSLQIVFLCLFLILLVSSTITVIFYGDIRAIIEDDLKETSRITLESLNANIRAVMISFTDLVENGEAIFHALPDKDVTEDVFIRMGETNPNVLSLYYGSVVSRHASGGYYVDSSGWEPEYEWDPPNRFWHQAAMANPGKTMIIDPYVDAETEELVITIARTVKDNNGNISGVIAIDVLLNDLMEIVLAEKITDDGSTVLIDADGLYIVHSDLSVILEQSIFSDIPWLSRQTILNGNIEVVFYGNYYAASAPVEGTEWFFVSIGSLDSMREKIMLLLRKVILVMTVLLLASALLVIILTRQLVKPLRIVAGALKEISADWNLTRRLDSKKTGGTAEIAIITEVFNITFESIKNLIIKINKEAQTLSDIGNDLAGNMHETAAAVSEITSNAQNVKSRVINQNESVTQTHATMNRLVTNINKLNDYVEDQSSHIAQASSAIEQMAANIHSVTSTLINNNENVISLREASEAGRTGLSKVEADIKEIARESEGLLQINQVMENIASQTNLLSMNAAIEAAHAGEAGKGFAVVAGEIRKLAENSSEQSKTIGTVLKKIKESIDKITSSTQDVLNKFEAIETNVKTVSAQEENILNAMKEQGQGSEKILEGISSVNEITRKVEDSSHEMLEGAKEVIEESNNLDNATSQISVSMNEMAAGAEHIDLAVKYINDITAKNREAVNILIKEVERFKVE